MEVKDIEINKIRQFGNIRQRLEEHEVHDLMASIKQDGLLEPIGLQQEKNEYLLLYGNRRFEACKKLGWKTIPAIVNNGENKVALKEIIIKNTVENVQREDVTAVEQGRIYHILSKDYKMTESEIASRFALPKKRVQISLRIYRRTPEEYREKVKFISPGISKKGFVPAATADRIIQIRKLLRTKERIKELFDAAREDGFTANHITIVQTFLKMDYSVTDAIKMAKDYEVTSIALPIKRNTLNKICKKYKRNKTKLFADILRGDLKISLEIPNWKKMQT